tara:strand:- start:653 stop:1612 length:960 start_codon:yes stop_codon:yes gene_type:complete
MAYDPYKDILSKMSNSLYNPSSKFNQNLDPYNFGSQNFGDDDDTFSDPGDTPDTSTPAGYTPSGAQAGSGSYGTSYGTLSGQLGDLDAPAGALQDPGTQYGFGAGSEYAGYFLPFDTTGYNESVSALKAMEKNLFSGIAGSYTRQRDKARGTIGTSLDKVLNESSATGLQMGSTKRRMSDVRDVGEENLLGIGQDTRSRYLDVHENIGARMGEIESSVVDFLSGAAQQALQIQLADPTSTGGPTGDPSGWPAQPKGNPYGAGDSTVTAYQSVFADLTNSAAAYAYFVSLAHTNLNSTQLAELAQSVYAQYQGDEESGGN